MGSETGKRLIEGAKEALEIARGNQPAARIHFHGHAYVPENRWLPIDMAPKDGTAVIAYWPHLDRSVVAWFDIRHRRRGGSGWVASHNTSLKTAMGTHPAYWMPLPPPPESVHG